MEYGVEAEGKMSGHVLEEAPTQLVAKFSDDPLDVGPEVAGIVFAFALSGHAERLAGVSCNEGVEGAGIGPGVEGFDVVPDWGGGEVSGPHPCDEDFARVFFPFDPATGVELGLGEHEAHIQASTS